MRTQQTTIEGAYLIELNEHTDRRGNFIKNYAASFYQDHLLEHQFEESYFSISDKGVIRGMHFQVPPKDHAKLVTVLSGHILDVILDIRPNSKTYRQVYSVELAEGGHRCLYIPRGCAHGFCALRDRSMVYYMVTAEYSPEHDKGILYNSFNFNWPVPDPLLSARDLSFPSLDQTDVYF